jgi:hypothetical protein
LLFLAALILSGCAPKAPIEGFRDMKWGDGIEKLGNYTIKKTVVKKTMNS